MYPREKHLMLNTNQAHEAQYLMGPYINTANQALRPGIQTGHSSGINSSHRLKISNT